MSVRDESQHDPFQSTTFLRRVVAASMAGTVVEWYEFFLYGTAATLVFSKVFFPRGGNELDAILAAFVTYAVGFAARPLGGVVFGQLGDRYGRKKLLQFSLLLVGAVTVSQRFGFAVIVRCDESPGQVRSDPPENISRRRVRTSE